MSRACVGVILLLACAGSAAAQGIARISVASDGSQANGFSYHPSVSADDRFAAYDSTSTNLVPGDTNAAEDIFVYDSVTRVTSRESVGPGGVQANGPSTYPAISATGRYVAFMSTATNLVPGVTGPQIYIRDRQSGVTTIASVSSSGTPANALARFPRISADGRLVSFTSTADNLVPGDTNGVDDAFTRDVLLGTTSRDSLAVNGTQNAGGSFLQAISGDGRYVAFTTNFDMFVRDRVTGTTTLESLDTNGQPLRFAIGAALGTDGREIAFSVSSAGPIAEVYLRDRLAMQTVRLRSFVGHVTAPALSADARFVTFAAAGFGGSSGTVQVFDRLTGSTSLLAATSQTYATMVQPAIGTGAVAFQSEFPITAFDTNLVTDVFATRVADGGGAGAPTGLAAAVNGGTVVLTWSPSATGGSALGYLVEAGSAPGAVNLANVNTGSSATSYTATGVGAGTYFVRVRALSALGPSDPSNEIAVVVSPACVPPGPAGNLIAVIAASAVTFTWSGGTNASSYMLEAGSASGQTDVIVADLGSPALSVTANGVGSGRYFVRVRSKNACGVSGPSNETVVDVR